jgi:hypothetical protein
MILSLSVGGLTLKLQGLRREEMQKPVDGAFFLSIYNQDE